MSTSKIEIPIDKLEFYENFIRENTTIERKTKGSINQISLVDFFMALLTKMYFKL